jgi:hypothetical protein
VEGRIGPGVRGHFFVLGGGGATSNSSAPRPALKSYCPQDAVLDNGYDLFCSLDCERDYYITSNSGAIRRSLFKLERGVCQLCHVDCHALVAQLQVGRAPLARQAASFCGEHLHACSADMCHPPNQLHAAQAAAPQACLPLPPTSSAMTRLLLQPSTGPAARHPIPCEGPTSSTAPRLLRRPSTRAAPTGQPSGSWSCSAWPPGKAAPCPQHMAQHSPMRCA